MDRWLSRFSTETARSQPDKPDSLPARTPGMPTLEGGRSFNDWARLPLDDLERQQVALRIESREYGTLWLCSTETERQLAEDGQTTYTIEEARRMIGLPEPLVRQIHAFKRVFHGTLERIDGSEPESSV